MFSTPEPLWPFGYGLSYSDFEYSDFCFDKENYGLTDTVRIQVNVKNKSAIEGKSTVQVYVRDLAGSVVMPMKQLKGFSKVTVPAYGSTLAEISVPVSELGLYDMNMRYVVEPGDFDFMIGTSSDSICFKKTIHVGEVDAKAERVSSAASKETQTVRTGKKMIVKGVVRDVQAKTLDDVKVSVKGRKGSVITNGKGEYSIEATSASVLVFSRKGYEMQEVEVNSQKTLNITLLNKI